MRRVRSAGRAIFAGLVLLLSGPLVAQSTEPASVPEATEPSDTRTVEIQTAGYYELVARARELGLETKGSVDDLRARVAQALGVPWKPDAPRGQQTLTIDSAREAGLVTVDAPEDGKLLRLSGGLQVTLVDLEKQVTHVIVADELWYDQEHEEMTARGNVAYTMKRETSEEVFRGESLTFRLSDSQGVFYEGASDRPRTVGTQTLTFRYGGQAIRRSSSDLVVLSTGTITSSLGKEPYYRIKAKTIWVLAPGEWGLQDAVLYLGRVPMLYFPFFFQPGDEFFFNPVLSFPDAGDRRGTSLQTTTYFWGKKTSSTSPLSFLQLEDSEDDQRVVKGLFLVRGDPPASTVPDSWVLKYQADFYSNLGFLTGVQFSTPGAWSLQTVSGFLGLGITRTVSSDGQPFSVNPFQAALDPWDQSDWNGSWVGSTRLPFRWGGNLKVNGAWGGLDLEYYTDPLLANDLTGNRSEDFSVFSLVGLGPARTTATATEKSGLQWTGSFSLAPVTAGASLVWDSKDTEVDSQGPENDPENSFYYPTQLVLPQVSLGLSGTLWPWKTTATEPLKSDLLPPETGDAEAPEEEIDTLEEVLLGPATLSSLQVSTSPEWTTGVGWSLKPTLKTDTRFDSSEALAPSDPTWKVLTSRWTGSYDGKLNLSTGISDGTWTTTQSFNLHQQVQDTWYQGPGVTATQEASNELLDLQQTSSLLSQTLTSTYKPFQDAWRESNLQYTFASKLWEDTYQESLFFDGTGDTVTTHTAGAQAIVYLLEGEVTLKAKGGWLTTLEPIESAQTYSGGLDLGLGWAKASTKASVKRTETEVLWDPWETSAEWLPWDKWSLKETYQHDIDQGRPLLSTTALSAWGLVAQYRHQRTTPYHFDSATRAWVAEDEDFVPQELRFSYALDVSNYSWWYHRHNLSSRVNLSWPINLQKYSDMPLGVDYTLQYKLLRFLDLNVTGGMTNKTAYRYFPSLVESFGSDSVEVVNPLVDLWDSISIWDQAALQRSGFKMTKLSLALVHYLDDWQVKLDYSGAPTLNTAKTAYQWEGTLTLLISWYPIPELKTQVKVDDGELTIPRNTGS